MAARGHLSPVDARLRAIAVLLEPALRLSRIAAVPLDDVQKLVATGYFREARAHGLSFRQIARRFDKSVRTITTLSKSARGDGLPASSSERITWRRQIAELVAHGGIVDEALLVNAIPEAPAEDLATEIEHLIDQGILTRQDSTLTTAATFLPLISEDVEQRLAALRHFLAPVTQLVYRRFFTVDSGEAFARVLTFAADPNKLSKLRARVYDTLHDGAAELDATAGDEAGQASICFGVVLAPSDRRFGPRKPE